MAALGNRSHFNCREYPAGAEHFLKTGESFPEPTSDDMLRHSRGAMTNRARSRCLFRPAKPRQVSS